MPDYEKLKFEVIPSDKPVTQPARPVFQSDFLPKKKSIVDVPKKSNSPPEFKF